MSGFLRLIGYFVDRLLAVFSGLVDSVFYVVSVHSYLVFLAVLVSTP